MNRPTEPESPPVDAGGGKRPEDVPISFDVDVSMTGEFGTVGANGESAFGQPPEPPPTRSSSAPPDPAAAARDLIAMLEQEAKARNGDRSAAQLYHQMGRLWELRLKSPRNAAACYQSAYNLDPSYRPNLASARRLFSQVGNWQMVEQLLDAELRSVAPLVEASDGEIPKAGTALQSPEVRGLMLEKASLLAERLERPVEAGQILAQLQSADPNDPTPAAALESIEAPEGAPPNGAAQAKLFVQLADAVQDVPLKVYYLTTAASLHEEQLKQPDEAAALYRRAFELNRQDPAALAGAKAHAERQERWDELLQILYSEAKGEKGTTAAAILYQAARLCSEKLGRDGDALEALVVAREHAPQDPLVLGELGRLYEQAGRFPELAEVLSARALGCRNPLEAVEVQLKLGALYEEKLGREEDAIACYRAVLSSMPHNAIALASLGKLYYRRGMWQELLWTYEQEITAATDVRTRIAKQYKSAEVLDKQLNRVDDAIARYNQVLEQQPGFLPAQQALIAIFTRLNRLQDLCDLLEKEIAQTRDRDQRISLQTQVAQMYEQRLNQPEKAIAVLKSILEDSSDHLPTVRALAQLCERTQHWKDLVWANELEASLAGDQKQVISLLHQTGEILEEHIGDKDAAVETYRKLLALAPSYLPGLKALGKLYAQRGQWEELVAMYRQEAEVAQSTEEAASLILKIGQLYEDKLLREEQAISAYREVLKLLPSHLPTLAALRRIFRNQRNWDGLLDTLRAEADARPDPNDRAPVLFAIGEVAEQRLNRADLASDAYQEVLRLVPDHALALRALERLYSAGACWRELCQVYERQLGTAAVGPARAGPYLKLARLYAERLGDPQKAVQCFESALASAPDPELTLTALKGLERLRGTLADRSRRADIRGKLAARLTDKRMASQLELAAGLDRERAGGSPEPGRRASGELGSAVHDYRRALELWPDNERAASALESALRRSGDFGALAELLQLQLDRALAGPRRAQTALELGELYHEDLKEPEKALRAVLLGLADEPQSLPLLRLARTLQAATGDLLAAHGIALAEADAARDSTLAVDAMLWAADLALNGLGKPDIAAADYRRVLDRDPLQREAADRLSELLSSSGDAAALLEVQERQAQALVAKQDPQAADALVDVALRIDQLTQDPDRALAALDQAIALQPEHGRAVLTRGDLLERMGRFEEAAEAFRRAAELGSTPQEVADAHYRLGLILQDRLGDPAKAATHLQAAVSSVPQHYGALERLALAHEASGNWTSADYALGQLESVAPDSPTLARALLAHARVLLDGLGDGNAALQKVQRAHGLLPEDPQTLTLLCTLEQRLRDFDGAAKTCERLANFKEATDPHASRAFRMRAAEIYSQELRRPSDAVLSYRRALDLDPSDETARAALADLYAADPSHLNDAISEHRWLLRADAGRVDSYRALYRIFTMQQQQDRAYCATAVLGFLQVADEEPANIHAELRRRLPTESALPLTQEQHDKLLTHPEGRTPLGGILAILGEHLDKVAIWPQEDYSLGRGDKLKPDHPLRTMAQGLARDMGGGLFEIYQGKGADTAALPVSPPAIVVGPLLVRRFQSREQRFLLARLLARAHDGSEVAAFVNPEWICDLIGAAIRMVQPQARVTVGRPGPQMDELEKRLQKNLPRKARRTLEERLTTVVRAPPDGGMTWARSLPLSADRAALLFAVDVASGLNAALGIEDPNASSAITAVRERPELAELCRFAVSEELFQLRAALRLGVI